MSGWQHLSNLNITTGKMEEVCVIIRLDKEINSLVLIRSGLVRVKMLNGSLQTIGHISHTTVMKLILEALKESA